MPHNSRPRLLDLFCGAGGAGMGYHRAGFEVVGVDIEPHPSYPFEFILADARDVLCDVAFLRTFAVLTGGPPCPLGVAGRDRRYVLPQTGGSRPIKTPCHASKQADGAVMFNRERPPLAVLLTDDTAETLRRIHQPMTGTLRSAPGQKQWCRGCGGTVAWRCPTIRVLDGEPLEAVDVVGAPYRFDEENAS